MMDHEMRMKGRKGVFGGSGNGMEKREFAVASWFLLQYFLIKIKKEILVIQLGHDCFGLVPQKKGGRPVSGRNCFSHVFLFRGKVNVV